MTPVNNFTCRWDYTQFMNSFLNRRLCIFVLMVHLFHLSVFSTLYVYRSERNLSVFSMQCIYQSERNRSVFSMQYIYQSERNLGAVGVDLIKVMLRIFRFRIAENLRLASFIVSSLMLPAYVLRDWKPNTLVNINVKS